jgi:hypothetical protein
LFAEVGFVSSAKIERAADGTSKGWGCALALALITLVSLTMGDIVYTICTYYHTRTNATNGCSVCMGVAALIPPRYRIHTYIITYVHTAHV